MLIFCIRYSVFSVLSRASPEKASKLAVWLMMISSQYEVKVINCEKKSESNPN
jgi:hypothetical protein